MLNFVFCATESSSASYDPLAALMAPPPRAMPSAASFAASMDADPLSALMAPPPRAIGGSAPMGLGLSSIGGPPPTNIPSHAVAVPKFWVPPPVPSTFKPLSIAEETNTAMTSQLSSSEATASRDVSHEYLGTSDASSGTLKESYNNEVEVCNDAQRQQADNCFD